MKITEIVCQILRIQNVEAKTASSQDSVLVRVRTDTGLEGIGEADSSPGDGQGRHRRPVQPQHRHRPARSC